MLGKGSGYVQCPNDQALETWPVETRLFLLFPKDLLEADAAGLAVSSGLDSQLWFVSKCTKKKWKHPQSLTFLKKSTTLSIVVKKNLAGKTLNPPSDDWKVSKEKGRRERFLKTRPKVKGKVTTPVSRSMLIRAPTPRDPDGSKMLFLGEIKFS